VKRRLSRRGPQKGFVLGSVLCLATSAATERTARTLEIARDTPIIVEATVGRVSISGSDRADIAIEIVRRARSPEELVRLQPVIEQGPRALRIAAVQPGEEKDPALRGDITINAPVSAKFESVRVFEGGITLTNLRNTVSAEIQRGPIDAATLSGRVRLETASGELTVRDATASAGGLLRLRTFNGNVNLQFSTRPANARILALTLNGTITSEIPLTVKDRFGPRFGEATLGTGDPVVSIDVVTGNVHIKAGL
jgi:hypothetical protein